MAIRKVISRSILDTTGVDILVDTAAPARHSVNPSLLLDFANSKTMDPRVTFTRGSSATFYDGSTAKAEENLLKYSQQFDFAPWSGSQFTLTANATTAPDGTSTAESLVPSAVSTANHQLAQNITLNGSSTYTISIYVKAFGYTKFAFRESVQTGAYATFNLASTGSVISTGSIAFVSLLNATITSVANGWFRLTATFLSYDPASLGMGFYALNDTYTSGDPYSAGVATGNGTSGVYIWGAQLEQRNAATAYTATTTTPIANYNTVLKTAGPNQPRFDENPITLESRGLMVEEQRTNLFTYSQDFTDGSWVKSGTTIQTAVGLDGTLSAVKLSATTSSSDKNIYKSFTTTAQTYTMSVYAKAGGINSLAFYYSSINGGPYPQFNLTDGTATNGGIMQSVGNGWYRCSHSFVAVSASNLLAIYINSTSSMTGNGFDGIYIWGAQCEVGPYATSYIPTVAAAATRSQDFATMTGTNFSSWYNGGEGSFYADYSFYAPDGPYNNPVLHANDGTENNYVAIFGYGSAYGWVQAVSASSAGITVGGATAINTQYKAAVSYKTNDFAFTLNGATVGTDASGGVPAVDRLYIGWRVSASRPLLGTIKKIAYYPERLTNAEIVNLTTA
jgi:hypothetical protein